VFVSGKPFQLSLMFVGKAGACTIEEPFGCSTLGVRQSLPGTNSLAYYEKS
jgi:hypothetical protein